MDERKTCELCGEPIEIGQAWMVADQQGAELRAHAGCVYRDDAKEGEHPSWKPQERAAS